MKLLISTVFIFISCQIVILYGQWDKTYGGVEFENGSSVEETNDGGYIFTGATNSLGNGDPTIWLVKTNSIGDTLWTKSYGGDLSEEGFVVKQSIDGGYIMAARKGVFPNNKTILIKADSQGDTLWTRTFGGNERFSAFGLEITSDGGYLLSGHISTNATTGPSNTYLIKTNINGDTLWTKEFGGSGNESGHAKQTTDGGYIICSSTTSFGNAMQLWLIRTDNQGDTLWTKIIGDTGNELGVITETSDGGFVVAGSKTVAPVNDPADLWLLKTDDLGNVLWEKTYGGTNHDAAGSIEETSDNGFIIGARTNSFGSGESDFWMLKTNDVGDTLWTRTFGGNLNDYAGDCHETSDGGFIFFGYTESFGSGDHDLWLIKTDNNGFLQINKNQVSALSFYPNPVNNTLFISSQQKIDEISIYTHLGKKVQSTINFGNKIDVSNLSSGVYLMVIETNNGTSQMKFVKE